MTPGAALGISFERLEMSVAAMHRVRAAATLELAQGISAGFAGGDPWKQWQQRLIKRINEK